MRALLRGEEGEDDAAIAQRTRAIWTGRSDRYSAERALRTPAPEQREKVEMSYIGG